MQQKVKSQIHHWQYNRDIYFKLFCGFLVDLGFFYLIYETKELFLLNKINKHCILINIVGHVCEYSI